MAYEDFTGRTSEVSDAMAALAPRVDRLEHELATLQRHMNLRGVAAAEPAQRVAPPPPPPVPVAATAHVKTAEAWIRAGMPCAEAPE